MRPHSFDPVSAALGVIAVTIGALVAFGGTDSIDTGWWLALGALVLGVGLVPWTRHAPPPSGATDAENTDPITAEPADPPRLRL